MNSRESNTKKRHDLRIGESFSGYLIGIEPPIAHKKVSIVSKIIAEALSLDTAEVQSSTVFSQKTHNEFVLGDIERGKAISIAMSIEKALGDKETIIVPDLSNTYQASNTTLFDD
ncbi:MAG: hypothetical protein WCI60_00730 [bacterium]